jgi:uncharacterized protein YdhG (YjbR/CyaY superfamily)
MLDNGCVSADEIDDYLASLPEPKRGSLEQLRRDIRAEVPEAEEGISYGRMSDNRS